MKNPFSALIDIGPLKKYPDFRYMWMGQLISLFGSMISYVAIPYQVYQLTKSSFWVGSMGAIQLVPLLIFGLVGGTYADRLNRKKLLIWCEVILALTCLILAFNSWIEKPSWILILITGALSSGVFAFHRPAMESLTPRLVSIEDQPAASALKSFMGTMGMLIGPALAGVVIVQFGLTVAFIIDFLTFAFSVFFLMKIKAPLQDTSSKEMSHLQSLKTGLQYAMSRPELVGTYLVDIVAMVFAMPMALYPEMADHFGKKSLLGVLYSSMAAGAFAVTLFSRWNQKVNRQGAAVILAATFWGLAIIGAGLSPNIYWIIFFLGLAGAADMVSGMFRGIIWNQTIPDGLRGRLAGIEMISYMSGPMLGNLRAGWMSGAYGLMPSILYGGILCTIACIGCIFVFPKFWKYHFISRPLK